jgi:MFS family permease
MLNRNAQSAELGAGISRPLVLPLAFTCGAAVANLYYAQPLLHTIAHAFSVSNSAAGLLVTVTQAGYVAALALLVPLGDLLERRRLIAAMLLVAAAGLGLASAAPSFAVFALAVAVLGVTAVLAQIIVAMSSSLASEHERGSVAGTVMSGLLIGILAARTISGIVAQLLGWRVIFAVVAGATVLLAGVLLWTSVAFLLSGVPYHYGNAYMVAYFSGGVALSATTSALYASGGWGAVCALGAGTAAVGLITWLVTERVMTGRLPIGADSSA